MEYEHGVHVRLNDKQMKILRRLVDRSGDSKSEVMRYALEIVGSEDHVVVPITVKERLFIEEICETAGVQPSDAVKMVLLSYHTLMSSPLYKIVKPVDQIIDEMKAEKDE